MPWDPDRYHRFSRERFAPFEDLVTMIDHRPHLRVVDLGCGTGVLTRRLADLLPDSEVVGIDSSPEMLERAEEEARPGLSFALGRIEDAEGQWDLVFSHAAIQWVTDHDALLPRLMSLVRPGGQIAIQLPSNHRHPALALIPAVARGEPFCQALHGWFWEFPALTVDRYVEILHGHGGEEIVALEKVYPHILEDADALADWSRGTALVPYFDRLPHELREPFMERYRQMLRERWPGSPVFYGFRRILFSARVRG